MYMTINERLQIGNTSNSIMTMDEYKNVFASVKVSVTGDFNSKQMPGTMARLGTSSTKFWSDDIENVKANIKEVNFVQLDNSEIDARYNAASIKSDVTTMEEYPIKVWLEVNETDSTMYTMYVASEEEIYFPSKSAYMFYAFNSLEKITFENIDTSQTTTMQRMFSNSASLTEINGLEKFDTSKFSPYDGFNAMFLGCSSLTNLNLSFFDVSNAKNLSFMFDGCSSLTSLNLNSWNTSNVDNISGMFEGCSSLVTLNLSNFSTEKVTQSRNVFNGCVKLKTLDISNFVYNSLTSAFTYENMFANVGSNLPEGTYTTVYVKPDYVLNGKSYSPQSWILNLTGTNRPSGWSTSNVIVKQ